MFTSSIYSQTDTIKKNESDDFVSILVVEKMPEFKGGNQSLKKYINTNALYTIQAKKDSIEGTVIVSFWIETDGKVSNVKILRGVTHDLDSITLNLINNMPSWIPASQKGKPIRTSFTLPINFKLHDTTISEEPIASAYWKKRWKRKFEKVCKKTYNKSQEECNCWYNFILWNYNSLHLEMLDLKYMFEHQKCDTKQKNKT